MSKLPAVLAAVLLGAGMVFSADKLEEGFRNPPDSSRAWVLYFVGDRNDPTVTREGLTRDLEAMRAQGLGGVVFFYGWMFRDPDGTTHWQNEPEWWETMRFAIREAKRVGLQVVLFNSPIWNSGGPWVAPEDAMKEFTWSRMEVEGPGKISQLLPPLPGRENFVRDVFVVAYPRPGGGRTSRLSVAHPLVTSSPHRATGRRIKGREPYDMIVRENPLQSLMDGNGLTSVTLEPGEEAFVEYTFEKPFSCDSLYLQLDRQKGAVDVEVFARDAAGELVAKHRFTMDADGSAAGKAPVEPRREAFPMVEAKSFRVVFKPRGAAEIHIAELELLNKDEMASGESFVPFFRARSATRPPFPPEAFRTGEGSPPPDWIVSSNEVIDLTSQVKEGRLDWDVPPGKWTVLRFGYTLTGVRIVPEQFVERLGEGFEVDRFDRAALERHFNAHIAKFLDDPALKGAIQGIEEDSWEVHWQTWSPGFPKEFDRRRGYEIVRWLPALTGEVVDGPVATNRFLGDFRQTISDLIADNFYGTYRDLARSRGVQFYSEAAGPRVEQFPPTDPLQFKGRTDVPMGEFHSFVTDKIIQPDNKEAASAAHLYGRDIVVAEAFTGLDDFRKSPFSIKALGDRAFCLGINRFFLHVCSHKPDERKPGPVMATLWGVGFNRHQTWWPMARGLFDYFARCQYLLQQGRFSGDLLYYYGAGTPAFAWKDRLSAPPPPGYDFDWCNTELLLSRLSVKEGKLVTPEGASYHALVLDDKLPLTQPVRDKLEELERAGAWIFHPQSTQELADALTAKGLGPDCLFEATGDLPEMLFIHRVAGEGDIYFLSNQSDGKVKTDVRFRVAGRRPELWDPVAGKTSQLSDFREKGDHTVVPLVFEPRQSWFVVFRKKDAGPAKEKPPENFPRLENILELEGPWKVSFDSQWGGPGQAVFERLQDWTRHSDAGIRNYSGMAVYRLEFEMPVQPGQPLFLDLGKVGSVARVRVNGTDCGIVWCAPWRVGITAAVQKGKNLLEIDVANTWINRLLYDQTLPEAQRLTWTNASRKCLGNSGPIAAGLMGPVVLQKPPEEGPEN